MFFFQFFQFYNFLLYVFYLIAFFNTVKIHILFLSLLCYFLWFQGFGTMVCLEGLCLCFAVYWGGGGIVPGEARAEFLFDKEVLFTTVLKFTCQSTLKFIVVSDVH